MDSKGKFSEVLKNMMIGREGMVEIEKAKDGRKRVSCQTWNNEMLDSENSCTCIV